MANSKNQVQSQARPGYFLVRPTGKIVPLIAADELPPEISLQEISKTLEIEETAGMLNLGVVHPPDISYKLLKKANKPSTKNNSQSNNNPQTSPGITAPSNSPISPISAPASTTIRPSTHPHSQPQPKTNPVCKHWCAYGTCKWREHCRYLHSMPRTRAALHEAGLVDWPTWYRAQNPGMFNVLRRKGPANGAAGKQGRRMIPDSKQSVVEDGRVVKFVREDVVRGLEHRIGGEERDEKGQISEQVVQAKKDVLEEMPLVDV